ncbi:LCP family protein [Actinoplanes solisilvae]|uniref:LCP family protein n=1 Tax=Actinoplanes solisilvae TaxID=2486853 RepID=UPI000FD87D8D|nr:LCP family protein [Actinoplanes solisilvae]
MSAPTSPHGGSGRASVPSSAARASARPSGAYPVTSPQGGGGNYPPGGGDGPGRGTSYRGRKPRRWGRIALLAGLAVLIIAVIAGISLYGYAQGLDKDLKRTNAFEGITADRPAKAIEGTQNILLVGSDSRDPDAKDDGAGKWRADTLILMHIPADHKSAQLVSIPRDLWVVIPRSNDAKCGDGSRAKINAAFAFGGLPRAVHTVECLTDVKVDHVMAIDFGGFKEVTDALGGVDLKVEQTITSIHKPFRVFKKGTMHMNGDQALDWVRQRKQFARGDFARMQHQQDFLKALMDKAASGGTISNPAKLNAFLKSVTKAVTVDHDFSLTDMAVEMRGVRGSDLTFITSPNKGSDTIAGQSVVVSDKEKALALYKAMAADKMDEWMASNLKTTAAK